jgi:hypothetical protein
MQHLESGGHLGLEVGTEEEQWARQEETEMHKAWQAAGREEEELKHLQAWKRRQVLRRQWCCALVARWRHSERYGKRHGKRLAGRGERHRSASSSRTQQEGRRVAHSSKGHEASEREAVDDIGKIAMEEVRAARKEREDTGELAGQGGEEDASACAGVAEDKQAVGASCQQRGYDTSVVPPTCASEDPCQS